MCKPMVVTLPFVLLLLDYWPLQRIKPGNISVYRATLTRLIGEKIPFFIFAAIASAITIFVQHQDRAMESLASRPIGMRLANALVAYARYLEKTFWPVDLANPYLLTTHLPWGHVLIAGALLMGLSVWTILTVRERSYALVGWLWFLGTMVPAIGLLQVGVQSMADRYTYIPLLGVFWIVVWVAADLIGRWRLPGGIAALVTLLVLGTCIARTRVQLDYWRNGESLFRHTIATTSNNFVAFQGLGVALCNQGRLDEAVGYYLKALEFRPSNKNMLTNLNEALIQIDILKATTNRSPAPGWPAGVDYANAHNILGLGLAMNGNLDDATLHFRKALLYEPDNVNAGINLSYALVLQGRLDEAVIHLREALQYEPGNAEAHFNLGQALAQMGQRNEAMAHYKETLRLGPNHPGAREQLNQLEGRSQ